LAGHWEGKATVGEAETPIALDFEQGAEGWLVEVSYPKSGTRRHPVDRVSVEGDSFTLDYGSRNDVRRFEGRLEGGRMVGSVQFGTVTARIELTKSVEEIPYTTEDFSYTNGDVTIACTLYLPKGQGPYPALVMLHGSGNNERPRYRFLADFYARLGIACLISDKRGCGESSGKWREADFAALASDGLEGVKYLKGRAEIDATRIGMTGISQAGWIMVEAASRSSDVAFLLVVSGATYDVEREGYYDYEVMLKDLGYSDGDVDQAINLLRLDNVVTRSKGEEGVEEFQTALANAKDQAWYKPMGFVALPVKSPFRNFYRLIMDFDPRPKLAQMTIPALWLYGENDKSVHAPECVEILNELNSDGSKDWTIRMFANADHGVRVPPDASRDALPLSVYPEGFLEVQAAWLTENVLKQHAEVKNQD
jgi:pimeloyl-ACP methyl ester carboxylesterase